MIVIIKLTKEARVMHQTTAQIRECCLVAFCCVNMIFDQVICLSEKNVYITEIMIHI